MNAAELAALRERLGAALALLGAQAETIARLQAALEREGEWRRQAIRHARAIALGDAARVTLDQTSDDPAPGGWNDACEHIAARIQALAPAPAAEVST